jgi:hypothetical protein
VLSVIFFVYLGWLEFGIFGKLYKKFNRNKIDDSAKLDDENTNTQEKAAQRAEEEDSRRKEESLYMRASYSRMSLTPGGPRRAKTVGAQAIQSIQIQNNYPGHHMATPTTAPPELINPDEILNEKSSLEKHLI